MLITRLLLLGEQGVWLTGVAYARWAWVEACTCPSHGSIEGRYFFPDFSPPIFFSSGHHFLISRPMLDFLWPAGRAEGSLYRARSAAPLLAGCSGRFGLFWPKTAILGQKQNGTFGAENGRADLASARKRFSFQPALFVLRALPLICRKRPQYDVFIVHRLKPPPPPCCRPFFC